MLNINIHFYIRLNKCLVFLFSMKFAAENFNNTFCLFQKIRYYLNKKEFKKIKLIPQKIHISS